MEEARKIVNDLLDIEGIETALSSRKDGILLYCRGKEETNAEVIAAMCATFLGAGEIVASVLRKGNLAGAIMGMPYGKIIVMGAGPENFLAVITTPEANIQLVSIELLRALQKIKEIK